MSDSTQTIQDLGKLVKSKYPGSYDSIDDAELGRKVKTKYPGSYDQFIEPQKATSSAPQSTLSKWKGAIYDPTIGSIGQGARDLFQEGSRMKGAHEIISGAEKAAIPVGVAALAMNPEVTIPAAAIGAGGEYVAKHLAKGFGAGEDAQNLTGDIAGIAGGYAGGMAGEAIPPGMASRVIPAMKDAAPDLLAGAVKSAKFHPLSGLRSLARGVSEGAKTLFKAGVEPPKPTEAQPDYHGIANMFSALKGPETPIGEVAPPGKGPSVGMLERAVKSGTMTPEQFDTAIDKMPDLNNEAKTLYKSNVRTSIAPKAKITPDESKKNLSLGDLKKSVKNGLMDIDEYNNKLTKAGYNEEDRGHLTNILKKEMESEKEDEEEVEPPKKPDTKKVEKKPETKPKVERKVEAPGKTTKKESLKVEDPGKKTDSGKKTDIATPGRDTITHAQAQDPEVIKNLKPGARMTHKDGSTWTLRRINIDKIDPDEGNRIDQNQVNFYKGQKNSPHPELKYENGRYKVFEGHHRITAADQQGKKIIKAWVPEN